MMTATLAVTVAAANAAYTFSLYRNEYSYSATNQKTDNDNFGVVQVLSNGTNLITGDLAVFQITTTSYTICSGAVNITSADVPTVSPHKKMYYNPGYGTNGVSYRLRCSNLGQYWFTINGWWAP
jgi:hypothetical protein